MQNTTNFSLTHITRSPRIVPPNDKKPPLLLLLHGVGSQEQDLYSLASELDGQFFVVSARAPLTYGSGYGWYHVDFTENGAIADERQAKVSREILEKFIGEVVTAYDLDADRVYLAGFSQGAIMSLYQALHSPETVAGVVAMSGRLLEVTLAERAEDSRLVGLPILAVHGLYDTVLKIEDGRRIQSELSRLPVNLSYQEYSMGHTISAESLERVAMFLTAQLENQGKEGIAKEKMNL